VETSVGDDVGSGAGVSVGAGVGEYVVPVSVVPYWSIDRPALLTPPRPISQEPF
jgi:hypothetical protein